VLAGVVVLAVLAWPKPPNVGAAAPPNPGAVVLAGVVVEPPKLNPPVAGAAVEVPKLGAEAALFPNENEVAAGVDVAGAADWPNEKLGAEAVVFAPAPNILVLPVALAPKPKAGFA